MATRERVLDELRRNFRTDCESADSGTDLADADVDAKFRETETALELLLRDSTYTEAGRPKSGDWWDVVYRAAAIACGTISLCTDEGSSSSRGLYVTDADHQRTFRKSALVAWIMAAVEDTFYGTVSKGRASSAYTRRVPWRKISIVHRGTERNMHTLIAQHQSYLARVEVGAKRARDTTTPPPRKRVCPPPESGELRAQFTLDTFTPTTALDSDTATEAAALETEIADYKRQIAELELAAAEAELTSTPPPPCARDAPRAKQVTDADLAQLRQFLQVGARILDNLTGKIDADGL